MPSIESQLQKHIEGQLAEDDEAGLPFEAASIFQAAKDAEAPEEEEEGVEEDETDPEFQLEIRRRIENARRWREEHLDEDQVDATDRYWGRPLGNEQDGRSKVVSTDVRDTVLAMLPSILRVLFGPENVVEFSPDSPESVEMAKQMTKAVQYVVAEDNPGFMVHHSAIKDALVRRIGVIKWWWEEEERVVGGIHTGISQEQLALLENDEDVEDYTVLSQTPNGDGINLLTCEIRRREKGGKVKIAAIPPEEFLHSSDARSLDEALMVGHLREVDSSTLIAMGIDAELVEDKTGGISRHREGQLGAQRRLDETQHDETQNEDEEVALFGEIYAKYDLDGDGIAELLRIRVIGEDFEVIDSELADEVPFGDLCPDPEPHTVIGQSIDDRVADIQKIKSMVLRSSLDSLALSLNPQTEVVEGEVNMRDVMNTEIGAVVRVTRPGMIREVAHSYVGKEAFPMLTYMDEVKEARTGQSKASMGLHPDALQSSTPEAIAATLSGAQQALELVTRVFAENGIRKMYKGVAGLLIKHQDYARQIRVGGQFVEMDPRQWRSDLNLTVNLALGSGGMQEKIQRVMLLEQKQGELMQLGAPFVTWMERRNALERLTELAGEADATAYFAAFGAQEMQAWQKQQEEAEPEVDPSLEAMKEIEMAKLQLEQLKFQIEDDRKRDEIALDHAAKIATAQAQYDTKIDSAAIAAQAAHTRQTAASAPQRQ